MYVNFNNMPNLYQKICKIVITLSDLKLIFELFRN